MWNTTYQLHAEITAYTPSKGITHSHTQTQTNQHYVHYSGGETTPRYKIPLTSQPCGIQRLNKEIVVGCMDDSLTSFTLKGRRQWTLQLPASLTCMELLHHRPRSFKAVLVALQNREIRIYKDKFLVNCITMDVSNWRENPVIWSQSHTLTHTHTHTHTHTLKDVVVGLKFGQFGREDGVLVTVTQRGALIIKILKRSVIFEVKDLTPGPPAAQLEKLNIPKRTKVYVEQMAREKANSTGQLIYNTS